MICRNVFLAIQVMTNLGASRNPCDEKSGLGTCALSDPGRYATDSLPYPNVACRLDEMFLCLSTGIGSISRYVSLPN